MSSETTPEEKELLTIRVFSIDGHTMIKCDQVRGLFLATKDFDATMEQLLPALKLLANAGAKVPGVNV